MTVCRSCGSDETAVVYVAADVPVSSCALVTSRAEALRFPRGQLRLSFCTRCGFIQNDLFDPELVDYTQGYEESQSASETFRSFADETAHDLIDRHGLRGKDVLEVGCGKGEWLARLCELGDMQGIGLDPAFVPGRLPDGLAARVEVRREFFGEENAFLTGDLIACRHTLEHIGPVREFASLLRRAAAGRVGAVTFVEVPDTRRILEEGAFWDVYYEHAAYFTSESLEHLFSSVGFGEVDVRRGYSDQYLLLEAKSSGGAVVSLGGGSGALAKAVRHFEVAARRKVTEWDDLLSDRLARSERVVVWGASSKAVGFLTALTNAHVVEFAVDINPMKHGLFLPGVGQEIVPPSRLPSSPPDTVVVMNPVYIDEVHADLSAMGIEAELLTP